MYTATAHELNNRKIRVLYPVANIPLDRLTLPAVMRAIAVVFIHDPEAVILATKALFMIPDNNEHRSLYDLLQFLTTYVMNSNKEAL